MNVNKTDGEVRLYQVESNSHDGSKCAVDDIPALREREIGQRTRGWFVATFAMGITTAATLGILADSG